MITVAVAKVPWENIISVSLRRNPWNKVLSNMGSCHSELRKHKIVVEEDICVVFTKICRSCCLHDGILNDGMYAETLITHLRKASEVSSSLALTASQ